MSIRKKEGSMDVVQAARLRIRNVFSNGVPVYMSFSAGKDSLCMSHLVYDQIRQGRIDASQLSIVVDLSDISAVGLYSVPPSKVKVYLNAGSSMGVIGEYSIVVNVSRR